MTTPDPAAVYRAFEHAAWERAATRYDDSFGRVAAPFVDALLDAVGCAPGMQVLDVACGTGNVTRAALARGARVTGADFSAAMVAEIGRRHRDATFVEADAEALPFDDARFDAVVSGFGVNHFPRPVHALAEARRVTRPGGAVAFTIWSSAENVFQRLLTEAIAECGTPGTSLPTPPTGNVGTPEICARLLADAGFDAARITTRTVVVPFPLASAVELIEITARGTARGAGLIAAQRPETMPLVVASLGVRLAPYWNEASRAFAVPTGAIVASAAR
jgi:SAM-dependent methyltransferase